MKVKNVVWTNLDDSVLWREIGKKLSVAPNTLQSLVLNAVINGRNEIIIPTPKYNFCIFCEPNKQFPNTKILKRHLIGKHDWKEFLTLKELHQIAKDFVIIYSSEKNK